MNPRPLKGPDRLNVAEYVNMFPAERRNEVRRQIDLFKRKHGKLPTVSYHSLTVQLMENLSSRQRRLLEDVGICNNCRKGDHLLCRKVETTLKGDLAYCTCKCSGLETSLGAPGGFPRPSREIRKEFKKKFPQHEIDPIGHLF